MSAGGSSTRRYKVLLVGAGEIATTQHRPTIYRSPKFKLVATVDVRSGFGDLPNHKNLESALRAHREIDTVVICTPPRFARSYAQDALGMGLHVMMEKPPGTDPRHLSGLASLARASNRTLFTGYHSVFAPMVPQAKSWLARRHIVLGKVRWMEDVRKWHPGQQWITRAGGYGVMDLVINGISVACEICPGDLKFLSGTLHIPHGWETPLRGTMKLGHSQGGVIDVEFDWGYEGGEVWDISIEDRQGEQLLLKDGGSKMRAGGHRVPSPPPRPSKLEGEYEEMYKQFARLIAAGRREIVTAPFQIVTDALARSTKVAVPPFPI
jgi:D-galactose 1-dehydrogenase